MENIFDYAIFIKPDVKFVREYSLRDYSPLFRKKVMLDKIGNAKLYVCGLGFGYYYINGKKVSEDLFTAPVSDYRKTLWYNVYDVSHLLKKGENIFAVNCGNGFYNESLPLGWGHDQCQHRDVPKFILRLTIDGETALVSDNSWKCKPESATVFNQLRSGEYFDANLYEENWNTMDYDDSEWKNAKRDSMYPMGVFRECPCEAVREFERYYPVSVHKTGENKYVFDLGQNIAGYENITVTGNKGDELIIRHAEDVYEDFSLNYNNCAPKTIDVPFQVDRFICSGKRINWSPKFTYHGFRYLEVEGIRDIDDFEICGVFVHQAIKQKTTFECSNEALNKLFKMGVMASYSNFINTITDCPTREKLGWANDVASSTEQFLTTFDMLDFMKKYVQDIYDAVFSDGSMLSLVPSLGWTLDWFGDGPVCDAVLFEVPYRLYLHTGKAGHLISALPYFKRYLAYIRRRKNADGLLDFGLRDWTPPGDKYVFDRMITNAALEYMFYRITELAARVAGDADGEEYYKALAEEQKRFTIKTYIDENGRCKVHNQAPVAMFIYHGIYDELEPLKLQLKELVEEKNFHHTCGMLCLRRLYYALDICGLSDYAYKIINVDGYPGYKYWIECGATTLCEYWENTESKNHHMFSDFMSWLVKRLGGIALDEAKIGSLEYVLDPVFIDDISFVKCNSDGIDVEWHRESDKVILNVKIDTDNNVRYKGQYLCRGEHCFVI